METVKIIEAFNKFVKHLLDKKLNELSLKGLEEFTSDENNLYNPDGTLTEDYKAKIEEVKKALDDTNVSECILEVAPELDGEVLSDINAYVADRRKNMSEFENTRKASGGSMKDEVEWAAAVLDKEATTPEDKDNLRKSIDEYFEEQVMEELDDEDVAKLLKDELTK